jgi:hypothetical protein
LTSYRLKHVTPEKMLTPHYREEQTPGLKVARVDAVRILLVHGLAEVEKVPGKKHQ